MKVLDPRYIRSQRDLKKAFQRLLKKRKFSEISITDITSMAGLSRPTFYLHYGSREMLLADCFVDIEVQVLNRLKTLRKKETLDIWRKTANNLLFSEFERNVKLILTIIEVNQKLLIQCLIKINAPYFREYLEFHEKEMPENILENYLSFYAAGYSELVFRWLNQEPRTCSAEEMADFCTQLTSKYLKDIFIMDLAVRAANPVGDSSGT